jgi:hypothetical protein
VNATFFGGAARFSAARVRIPPFVSLCAKGALTAGILVGHPGCGGDSAGRPWAPERDAATTADATAYAADGTGGFAVDDPDGAGGHPSMAAATSCAKESVQATSTPLDVYFLFDASASMADLVGPGLSKWSAVAAAMTAFVEDPASAGINVALRFFSAPRSGTPATCTSNGACGSAGPCVLALCDDGSGTVCETDDDCLGRCVAAGACSGDGNYFCDISSSGLPCGPDPNGFDLGSCEPLVTSTCASGDSCSPSDYAAPATAFEALPDAAPVVEAALGAQRPAGATPTPPALQGAIASARAQATAHPDHAVVVVLATDGIPDEDGDGNDDRCASDEPSAGNAAATGIAAAGVAGAPSVRTFAIGVFTPDAVSSGTSSVEAIASAGGTGTAYVIGAGAPDAGGSVESEFAGALRAIRGASLPCRYAVPMPEAGVADTNKLNVTYAPGAGDGGASTVPRVDSQASCGTADGWFFDGDGESATTIDVCPATCDALRADPNGRVDVVIGCETVVR